MKKRRRNVNLSFFNTVFICLILPLNLISSTIFYSTAPKCGFIKGNENIIKLLDVVKPEITSLKETIITVSHAEALFMPPPFLLGPISSRRLSENLYLVESNNK